jgi:transcriptional regulator ATRX
VIKDKHLAEETKGAAAEERERRKRIDERQAAYNKIFSIPEGRDATCDQLVLDFDPKSQEILVEVHKKLVTKLKPHQVGWYLGNENDKMVFFLTGEILKLYYGSS